MDIFSIKTSTKVIRIITKITNWIKWKNIMYLIHPLHSQIKFPLSIDFVDVTFSEGVWELLVHDDIEVEVLVHDTVTTEEVMGIFTGVAQGADIIGIVTVDAVWIIWLWGDKIVACNDLTMFCWITACWGKGGVLGGLGGDFECWELLIRGGGGGPVWKFCTNTFCWLVTEETFWGWRIMIVFAPAQCCCVAWATKTVWVEPCNK